MFGHAIMNDSLTVSPSLNPDHRVAAIFIQTTYWVRVDERTTVDVDAKTEVHLVEVAVALEDATDLDRIVQLAPVGDAHVVCHSHQGVYSRNGPCWELLHHTEFDSVEGRSSFDGVEVVARKCSLEDGPRSLIYLRGRRSAEDAIRWSAHVAVYKS